MGVILFVEFNQKTEVELIDKLIINQQFDEALKAISISSLDQKEKTLYQAFLALENNDLR
jgi:hypothetical protein